MKQIKKIFKKNGDEEDSINSDYEKEIESKDIFEEVRLGWIDNYYDKISDDYRDLMS